MLILHDLEPYHWPIGGAGIGVLTLFLLYVLRQRLGISTGFENVCALVVRSPYFLRPALAASRAWRLPLLVGLVLGGILFGVGWSITGMCPGPILVNIGEGKLYALAALAGLLVGAATFGLFYDRLRKLLGLPDMSTGTGDG